jgi:hypothetical protein
MLGENVNPNTNEQVSEGQCPPPGQPLAQHTRPREANGQFTFTTTEEKKRSRKVADTNYTNKNARVIINKALESNLFVALGDLATNEGKNGKSRTKKGHTEMLVSLLSHMRLDDGTCFEVDPANNYEITKVRGPIHFCCTVALNFSEFQTKSGRRELGKIRYDSSDKSSTFFPTVSCTSACCSMYSYQIGTIKRTKRNLITIYTDQELVSLDSGSGSSSSGTTSSCSCSTTTCRLCALGHRFTFIYANGYVMLGRSDSGAQQLAPSRPVSAPTEQVMVQV